MFKSLKFYYFFERKKSIFFLRLAEMLWLDTKFHSNAFTERVWIFSVESFLATGWTIVGISEELRNVFSSLFLQLITDLKTVHQVKYLSNICLSHFHALLACLWSFSENKILFSVFIATIHQSNMKRMNNLSVSNCDITYCLPRFCRFFLIPSTRFSQPNFSWTLYQNKK